MLEPRPDYTLSKPALKAALRLSQLPDGAAYDVLLIKRSKARWELVIRTPEGMQVEVCEA